MASCARAIAVSHVPSLHAAVNVQVWANEGTDCRRLSCYTLHHARTCSCLITPPDPSSAASAGRVRQREPARAPSPSRLGRPVPEEMADVGAAFNDFHSWIDAGPYVGIAHTTEDVDRYLTVLTEFTGELTA